MRDLQKGQILWLKIRFNNSGDISDKKHPYLIIDIDNEYSTVEIAQIDSLENKAHKALLKSNKVIFNDHPTETVISKDSFVQLDNLFKVEYFEDLSDFRHSIDTLSDKKYKEVLTAYISYHKSNRIDENKVVYMEKGEIEQLNNV